MFRGTRGSKRDSVSPKRRKRERAGRGARKNSKKTSLGATAVVDRIFGNKKTSMQVHETDRDRARAAGVISAPCQNYSFTLAYRERERERVSLVILFQRFTVGVRGVVVVPCLRHWQSPSWGTRRDRWMRPSNGTRRLRTTRASMILHTVRTDPCK